MDFDVVIESQTNTVDMKSGLETLQGVSDAARCIAETVIKERVPGRKTSKSNVRTILKNTFIGSYGHIFSIEIFDDILKAKFDSIGRSTFVELMSFYLNDSVYIEKRDLSDKAKNVIKKLGSVSDQLTDTLRVNTLENIHAVSRNFDQDVKVRYRPNDSRKIELVHFDKDTAGSLDLEKSIKEIGVSAIVTRFNTKTGNGRLQLIDSNETVAFGFANEYQSISMIGKKKFSENLDFNNGLPPQHQRYLDLTVSPMRRKDNKIVKYIIEGYIG